MPEINLENVVPFIDDAVAVSANSSNGFSIKDTLIEMGKFTVGMAVLGKMSGMAGRGIYKQIFKKNETLASNIAANVGSEVNAAKQTMNLGSLFKGVRQELATNPSAVFKTTTTAGEDVMQALSKASQASIQAGKTMRNTYASWSTSESFAKRAAIGAAKHFYKAAPLAAGLYGLNRALGTSRDQEQPSWYNIPGHIGEIAKSTAEFAAFDMGLGGLKKLGGFAKDMAAKYLNKDAAPGLHAFVDKHFAITRTKDGAKAGSFLQTVIRGAALADGLREASKKVGGTLTDTFMLNWGNAEKRKAQQSALFDFSNKSYYKDLKTQTVDAFRSGYKSRMDSLKNYRSDYGADFVSSINQIVAKKIGVESSTLAAELRGGDVTRLREYNKLGVEGKMFGQDLSWFKSASKLLDEHSIRASKTMGGSVLGRQGASVDDILTGADRKHVDLLFGFLRKMNSDIIGREESMNLKNTFLGMKAGKGIYKSGNSVVDYNMYNPKNMLGAFTSFINPYFVVGAFGRELPLVKTLGLQKFLAKEGLGIHSIRADEGQRYYDTSKNQVRTVGDTFTFDGNHNDKLTSNLGGTLLDGELFVTNSEGYLVKANAHKQKMVYSTPYARDSILWKLNAQGESSDIIKQVNDITNLNKKQGISGKINNFTARWGLKNPAPIQWAMEGLNRAFGFSPMRTGVKNAVNLMLDPRSTIASLEGDASALIGAVGYMSDESSKSLYRTLSHPKMLDIMGRLSKDIGFDAGDRAAALKKAFSGTDDEVMEIIRGRGSFQNDAQLRYALEHHTRYKNFGLNEQVSSNRFSMKDRPLTRRDEIQRRLLNETLGMQHLPEINTTAHPVNLVDKILQDNEAIRHLSKDNIRDLKVLGTGIDLFHFGFLDGSGKVAADYTSKAKGDAFEIIRSRLKNDRTLLETKLFDTPMIQSIGVLGFKSTKNMDTVADIFTRTVKKQQEGMMSSSPFVMREDSMGMSDIGFSVNTFIDRVMDMGNHIGLAYGPKDRMPYTFKLPKTDVSVFGHKFVIGGGKGVTLGGPLANMTKRIAQGIGVMAAAQALDTFTDINPMFNGTILNNGVFSAAADVYVKSSMAFHKVQDLTGITSAAKYLEGLMPGSTATIPGAAIGGFMKGPMGIAAGAVINKFMAANGVTPDFDKSYDEMKEIYSGRELVPVRRNRFWLFSKAPYEGDGPAYFRPNWYPRLKSQYKYTDTLYGSKSEAFLYKPWIGLGINPIGQVLDKYHYEKKHYWDRPYPVSAPAFSEVPVIGKLLGATIGRLPIIGKPLKYMHEDEMSHYYSTSNNTSEEGEFSKSNMPSVSQTEQYALMNKASNVNSVSALYGPGRPRNLNPYGAMTVLGEQLYNFTELAGLKGYQLESMMGGGLADDRPSLSSASDMWSARRAYWDLSAGDIFGSTEFFRRFVPREKKVWQKVNPIRNKMSPWLPSEGGEYFQDFLTGDPYTKIAEGEMRLPGDAYNKLYDVRRSFPGRASSLGKHVSELVQSMVGLEGPDTEDEEDIMEAGTAMHRQIQDNLINSNIGIKAEQLVYDSKEDISGHIDLIMYDPYRKGGKRVLEIKTVGGKKFAGIKSPIPYHMSQVNFYLKQMQMDVGTLLYINRDDPSQIRTFDVRYSQERYRKDIQDLHKARKIAAGIMANGKGFETGTSYSWLDRLRILGDVAPYSKEYSDAANIIKIQMRENKLTEKDKEEVAKINQRRKSVMRKFDLYPTRFKGRVFNPDTTYELWSENTNIKAAANYSFSERVMGSIWERAIQMDTPLNLKLWNYQSPLQHYQRTKVYGTESATWNRPYQDFLKPMFTKARATNNPIDAAASFGWIGALGLGGMGNMALPGAVFGSLYGASRAVVGDDGWIPEEMQKKREIERTFDQLKYMKAMNMYENTGDSKYQTEAMNTIWNISHTGYDVGVSQAMKSLSAFEKPYFLSWMKETNPIERDHILEMVPEEVGNLLKAQWGLSYETPSPSKYESMIPNADWEGLIPNNDLSDLKVRTINQEGLRANDFGLGWYDQQRRMANSQFELNPVTDPSEVMSSNNVASKVKSALMRALGSMSRRPLIAVSMSPTGDDFVKVTLNLKRDRFNDIKEAMRSR